ncbi:MAG: restriction endonuclease [Nanoarchaeota archaeon]|nr:restriction endonuclease [Nanoarchaeota archaeon]MBU1030680.1 restriction endonuclease [Nanoarchaeota archaeon]MBU1849339.1 restriction endonuclease [Nanoarchaeota archaeon]
MKSQEKGFVFEKFIVEMLKDLGKKNIQHNQQKKKKRIFGEDLRFQIDITYGVFRKHYVECKYKEKNNVGLEDVAKFRSVLEIMEIPYNRGLMVTNKYYTERAKYYAKKNHIKLYNRNDLMSWCWKRKKFVEKIIGTKKFDLEKRILGGV